MILAIVADVPEIYENMKILIDLTGINGLDYKLSQDLKLTNIIIGITSHSSKYPCPYGECMKCEETGDWIKGIDRTVNNLSNQILNKLSGETVSFLQNI